MTQIDAVSRGGIEILVAIACFIPGISSANLKYVEHT